MARRIEIHADTPNRRTILQAVEVMEQGGIVAYPTDSNYGLGCDIANKRAVERLYRVRGLDSRKPLAFLCEGLKHISEFAWISKWQYRTMKRLIPGPYTFILEASRDVPRHMVKRRREVGIRVPDHPVPLALIRELGRPIISTSCGLAADEESPPLHPDDIEEALGDRIDLILDAGPCVPLLTTVVSLIGDAPEVLRQGEGEEFVL